MTQDRIFSLQKLEEDRMIVICHKEFEKMQHKYWHNQNIKSKDISIGDLVLLYNIRIKGNPKNLKTVYSRITHQQWIKSAKNPTINLSQWSRN